jgi:hypothetical protein
VKSELFGELKQELTQGEAAEIERKWSAKASCDKLRFRNNFIFNFNLGNRLLIPFKLRNIFPKVLWLGSQVIINSF